MDKNYKHINKRGEGWSLKAMAMGCPTKDVAISLALNKKLRQSEAEGEKLRIADLIQEWFFDSKLDPNQFICTFDVPNGYSTDKVRNSVFRIEIAVRTRKEIQMGSDSFTEIMDGELESLVEALGLLKI